MVGRLHPLVDDLHGTITVPRVEAALGTTVAVEGIPDGEIAIDVAPGTQPGAVLTLRGHGMPHLRSGARGDLHAHVEVSVPTRLDARAKQLLGEVRTLGQEQAAVKPTRTVPNQPGGGLFSRLRETFTGR